MRKRYSLSTLACLPVLACGGDSHPKITTPDAKAVDAAPACTASATYSSLVAQAETNYAAGVLGSGAPHEEDMDAKLNSDPKFDILHLWLYDGYGGFGSGSGHPVATGTYNLAGDDLSGFAKCGLCLFIDTDFDGSNIADTYYATAGTVQLTSVGTNGSGTLAGMITNATLAQVMVAQDGSVTPVPGCTTTLPSIAFSGTLAVGSAFQATGWISPETPNGQLVRTLHHRYY